VIRYNRLNFILPKSEFKVHQQHEAKEETNDKKTDSSGKNIIDAVVSTINKFGDFSRVKLIICNFLFLRFLCFVFIYEYTFLFF
jgi:hypothetical protein